VLRSRRPDWLCDLVHKSRIANQRLGYSRFAPGRRVVPWTAFAKRDASGYGHLICAQNGWAVSEWRVIRPKASAAWPTTIRGPVAISCCRSSSVVLRQGRGTSRSLFR
jgi:hypothetical protein